MLAADASSRSACSPSRKAPSVDPKRLEGGATAEQRLVVGTDDRVTGIHEAAAGYRSEQAHRVPVDTSTLGPIASRGRAFVHDSSISASGSESHTMPPPTQR